MCILIYMGVCAVVYICYLYSKCILVSIKDQFMCINEQQNRTLFEHAYHFLWVSWVKGYHGILITKISPTNLQEKAHKYETVCFNPLKHL